MTLVQTLNNLAGLKETFSVLEMIKKIPKQKVIVTPQLLEGGRGLRLFFLTSHLKMYCPGLRFAIFLVCYQGDLEIGILLRLN